MLDIPENATFGKARKPDMVEAAGVNLVPLLLSISNSMCALHGIKLGQLGFHNGQDEVLLAVDEKGLPVSVVADRLSVRPSTLSKVMDRLIEKGLMEQAVDNKDARRTVVRITPAGIEARKILMQSRAALEQELNMAFAGEHRSLVGDSLALCQTLLSSRLNRLR